MTNTRYNLLAETLRRGIADGLFDPTGDLPTEAELCAQHGVSRSTVRKALTTLRDEGLVTARQGSGWTVAQPNPLSVLRFSLAGEAIVGEELVDRFTSCRRVRPAADVARLLDATTRRAVIRVQRESRAGDVVVHRSTTWFNTELSGSLDTESASTFGPARMLQERGVVLGAFTQFAGADRADADDVAAFGVDLASPILQITRLVHDDEGRPLFVSFHRHPGGSVQVAIELPTSPQGATASLGDLRLG